MKRSALLALALLVAAGCSNFSVTPVRDTFEEGHFAPAKLTFQGELAVAQVAGTPAEMGAQLGPLLVGRNMDFAPANVLGTKTLVTVYRPHAEHAFVSVGWPGFAAVASGMNDEGLCALILINSGARKRGPGIPLGFAVRRILER